MGGKLRCLNPVDANIDRAQECSKKGRLPRASPNSVGCRCHVAFCACKRRAPFAARWLSALRRSRGGASSRRACVRAACACACWTSRLRSTSRTASPAPPSASSLQRRESSAHIWDGHAALGGTQFSLHWLGFSDSAWATYSGWDAQHLRVRNTIGPTTTASDPHSTKPTIVNWGPTARSRPPPHGAARRAGLVQAVPGRAGAK